MQFSYFELLSPNPIYIKNAGGIISPKLKDISSIGFNTYQYYLSILLMNLKEYFTMIKKTKEYEALSENDKSQFNIYDLLTMNEQSTALLENILNFFIKEAVAYSPKNRNFLIYDNEKIVGAVTKENYSQICDLIFQRNCIKSDYKEDLSKVKSKKALEIMKKLQKGRNEKAKHNKADKNMELGNIISAVANKSQSLNILNIWELTVFQVWDCFLRLSNNSIYNIQSMSVAAWGNKDNYFDANAWYKRIDDINQGL